MNTQNWFQTLQTSAKKYRTEKSGFYNVNYRVQYLIYSANTSLNTEHITIYFCEQTLSGHCLTITDHIKPKILCLSLNATSAEANFELGAEQCI